jgi:hypothetical protein
MDGLSRLWQAICQTVGRSEAQTNQVKAANPVQCGRAMGMPLQLVLHSGNSLPDQIDHQTSNDNNIGHLITFFLTKS